MRKEFIGLLVLLTTACEPAAEQPEIPELTLTPLQSWLFSSGPWGSAGAAVIDSTGNAIVAYSADGVVLSLDPSGEEAWRYGRTGGGPGEFTSIGSISVAGDTLFLADYTQQRMTRLSRRGELIGTGPARVPGFGGFHRLEGGDLAFTPYPPAASPEWSEGMALLRLDALGNVADTLAAYDLETFQISVADGTDRYFVGQPFSKDAIVRVSPFGDVVAIVNRDVEDVRGSGSIATVRWANLEGDTIATQRVPFPAVRLSRSTRDSMLARIDSALPALRSVRQAAHEQAFLPAVLPPVTRALVGGGGEVWLRGAAGGADSVTWIGVRADSGALGALQLAAGSLILASNGCYLLLSEQNALGVESLSLGTICREADALPTVRAGEPR